MTSDNSSPESVQASQNPTQSSDDSNSRKAILSALVVVILVIAAGIVADHFVKPKKPELFSAIALSDGSYDAEMWGPHDLPTSKETLYSLARRNPEDPFAIGPVDAPVVMVEFSDFECPFCALYANETEPEIIADYVATGKLRIEWNDMPVNGPNAVAAAKAGRAAAKQGKFAEFKHALYEASANVQGHPNNTIDNFVEFATTAGVPDIEMFKKDATGDSFDQAVDDATTFGQMIGVNGTPSFLVGNEFISGAQSIETFQEAIDKQLALVDDGTVTPHEPTTTDGRDIRDKVFGPIKAAGAKTPS